MNTINVRAVSGAFADENIWYPFAMPVPQNRPAMVRADGILLTDETGRQYYDAVSGLWNMPLGSHVPAIEQAVAEQLSALPFCSLFAQSARLAEEAAAVLLAGTAPEMERVIWGCTGSESIECAIKLMRAYQKCAGKTDRTQIVSLAGSYHGTHYGAISISGAEQDALADIAPVLPDTVLLDAPAEDEAEEIIRQKTDAAAAWFAAHHAETAGIVIEPVLASSGVKVIAPEWLRAVCSLCRTYDIPVAFDEVSTGFFRTGQRFYFQCIDIVPDLLCLSKAINNGVLPLSATVVSRKICERFRENGFVLQHGTTQGGNLCSLAAMIAADRAMNALSQRENLPEKAEQFYRMLLSAVMQHSYVRAVRHKGFLYAVILPERTHLRDIRRLTEAMQHAGVLVYPAKQGFLLLPALCTTFAEWETITEIIGRVLGSFLGGVE